MQRGKGLSAAASSSLCARKLLAAASSTGSCACACEFECELCLRTAECRIAPVQNSGNIQTIASSSPDFSGSGCVGTRRSVSVQFCILQARNISVLRSCWNALRPYHAFLGHVCNAGAEHHRREGQHVSTGQAWASDVRHFAAFRE